MSGQLDLFAEPCSITMHRLAFSDRDALDAYLEPWQQHPDPAIRTRVGRYLSSRLKAQYLNDPEEPLRIEALGSCAAPLEALIEAHSSRSPRIQGAAFASLARRSRELVHASDDVKVAALRTLALEERRAWRCWTVRPTSVLRLLPENRQAEVISWWIGAGVLRRDDSTRLENWICHGRFTTSIKPHESGECNGGCERRRGYRLTLIK